MITSYEQKITPRMYLVVGIIALVLVALVALISFEISQHMSVLWQAIHSVSDASPNVWHQH